MRRMIFGVMAITSVAAMALAADAGIGTRADADALQTKLLQIATNGLAQKPVSRNTPVTEREVNAFLRAHASESLPQGVIDPLVTILRGRPPHGARHGGPRRGPQLEGARHVQPVDDAARPCAG